MAHLSLSDETRDRLVLTTNRAIRLRVAALLVGILALFLLFPLDLILTGRFSSTWYLWLVLAVIVLVLYARMVRTILLSRTVVVTSRSVSYTERWRGRVRNSQEVERDQVRAVLCYRVESPQAHRQFKYLSLDMPRGSELELGVPYPPSEMQAVAGKIAAILDKPVHVLPYPIVETGSDHEGINYDLTYPPEGKRLAFKVERTEGGIRLWTASISRYADGTRLDRERKKQAFNVFIHLVQDWKLAVVIDADDADKDLWLELCDRNDHVSSVEYTSAAKQDKQSFEFWQNVLKSGGTIRIGDQRIQTEEELTRYWSTRQDRGGQS